MKTNPERQNEGILDEVGQAARLTAAKVLGPNHHAIDDIVSLCQRKASEKLAKGRKVTAGFGATIARNEARRASMRQANFSSDATLDHQHHPMPPVDSFTPGELLDAATRMGALTLKALEDLKDSDRDFLRSVVVEQKFNFRNAAADAGISEPAARVKFTRVTQKLLLKIEQKTKEPGGSCLLRTLRGRGCRSCDIIRGLLRIALLTDTFKDF
jgi:hypothetical protein